MVKNRFILVVLILNTTGINAATKPVSINSQLNALVSIRGIPILDNSTSLLRDNQARQFKYSLVANTNNNTNVTLLFVEAKNTLISTINGNWPSVSNQS